MLLTQRQRARSLAGAEMVVAMSAFKTAAMDYADVLLPISPFSETSGTFVNAEGRGQSFHGVVKPLGDTRPAWKVLRVLGNLLSIDGFDFETSEEVRNRALGDLSALAARLDNRTTAAISAVAANGGLSVWLMCRSIAPMRWFVVLTRCSKLPMPLRPLPACRKPCGPNWA